MKDQLRFAITRI